MPKLPDDISFDTWLDYVFGYAPGPSGFRESGDDWWDERSNPALAVAFVTRLFETPEMLLAPRPSAPDARPLRRYSDQQVALGLWYLASEGEAACLLEESVPWPARRRGLLSIGALYSRLFAVVCSAYLGHLDRGPEPAGPLNTICYMWWDLFPTWGTPADSRSPSEAPARATGQTARLARRAQRHAVRADPDAALFSTDDVILTVMERTLRLDSEACREGALHGLGHWCRRHPERVPSIIAAWLAERPPISPELQRYALAARTGCVL
jgi:hypothetical protein